MAGMSTTSSEAVNVGDEIIASEVSFHALGPTFDFGSGWNPRGGCGCIVESTELAETGIDGLFDVGVMHVTEAPNDALDQCDVGYDNFVVGGALREGVGAGR